MMVGYDVRLTQTPSHVDTTAYSAHRLFGLLRAT